MGTSVTSIGAEVPIQPFASVTVTVIICALLTVIAAVVSPVLQTFPVAKFDVNSKLEP